MNVVIHQSWIIFMFVLFSGVHTISVVIKGSKVGFIGGNGTEIECSYPLGSYKQFSVSFWAFNKSSKHFEQIATYIPNDAPLINLKGQYLKGRVTLTTITQSSTKAVMTFNKLMCIDDTSYQCQARYVDSIGDKNPTSNNTSISVQVPPSKPDSVLLVHTPAESSVTTTKHMDYSSSPPSTAVTSNENETVSASQTEKQNTTTAFNHSTIRTPGHNTTTSTPSHEDISTNSSNRTTTYSIQQTTTEQSIAEGDNITVVCTGDVGKPPAEHVFQKYLNGKIVHMKDTVTTTSIPYMPENCSYYRTSNLTFQVTADDNNAVIRCVVNSSMVELDMYVETAPIKVYSDISTTQSSSTGSSSGADDKKKKSIENTILYCFLAVVGVVLITVITICVYKRRNTSEVHACEKKSKSLVGSSPKPVAESRTGDYDDICLEEDANKKPTINNVHKVEDIREHNKEYLRKQEEDEQKKNESNKPPQPVYAQVNEATKSRNKQNTETLANEYEEGTYAETQEGIYDKAGDRRHKENEDEEHFDTSNNSSNGDTKSSIQSSQIGSYDNQAFQKNEDRKVATVSPQVRSSGASQDDKQTSQTRDIQSKKGYENVKDTNQTGTSEEVTSHQTAL